MTISAVHAYQFNQVLSIIFYMGPDIRIHLELILWIFWSTLICWGSSEWYTEMAEKAILIHYYRKSHYLNIKWFWSIFVSIKIIILIKLQTKISWSDFSWAFWSGSKWIFTIGYLTCFLNIPKCIKICSLLYQIRSLLHDQIKEKRYSGTF